MRLPRKEAIYDIITYWVYDRELEARIDISTEEKSVLGKTFYSLSKKAKKIEELRGRNMVAVLLALSSLVASYHHFSLREGKLKLWYPSYRYCKDLYRISGKPVRECVDLLHKVFKKELEEMAKKLEQVRPRPCVAPPHITCRRSARLRGEVVCGYPEEPCPFRSDVR